MNCIFVKNRELCTGCGVCASVCPVNAISFFSDDEGFPLPKVDESKCLHCGKCRSHCHLQSNAEHDVMDVSRQYAVKLKDVNNRLKSRSGGVFFAISDFILNNDGVVYGVCMENDLRVTHKRAETVNVRNQMCGSKYVQSDTVGIWEMLKDDADSGRPVLFTGTPCQIEAAYHYLNRDYSNLYFCDFVCHGVPGPSFLRSYIDYMEKRHKQRITYFEFRDKQEFPWESHVEKITFGNKTIHSRRYANLFCSNNCLRRSCYKCRYTTMNRVSDFTIGDYWGIDKVAPDFNDSKGISLLLIRGEKGNAVFESVKHMLDFVDTSANPPSHYNLTRPTAMPDTHTEFWNDYRKHGFGYVSRKYGGYTVANWLRRKIRNRRDMD